MNVTGVQTCALPIYVDHRRLAALLLQDVDPLVPVPRHRRRIAGKIVADVLVHGGERAQIAVGAFRHVDDHVPFLHGFTRCLRSLPPLWALVGSGNLLTSPAPNSPPSGSPG